MSAHLLPILIQGIALGVSLCCTLGPQSVFVLRQGIRRVAAIEVAAICAISDGVLIAAGAAGFGALLAAFPAFATAATWGSVALILAYGAMLLASALRHRGAEPAIRAASGQRGCRAMATAMALTFLNPQVYLEMIGVVGGVAIRFAETERAVFALGVMLVSPIWFFGLALGGRRLAMLLGSERAAFALDVVTAALMLGLGAALALTESKLF